MALSTSHLTLHRGTLWGTAICSDGVGGGIGPLTSACTSTADVTFGSLARRADVSAGRAPSERSDCAKCRSFGTPLGGSDRLTRSRRKKNEYSFPNLDFLSGRDARERNHVPAATRQPWPAPKADAGADFSEYESEFESGFDSGMESEFEGPAGRTRTRRRRTGTVGIPLESKLRLQFMMRLARAAREGDVDAAEGGLSEMRALGLKPGAKIHHSVVCAYATQGDGEGAVQALRRALATGEHPLPETFKAILQCFAKAGLGARVDQVLALLEREGHDALGPWQWVVDELVKHGHITDANRVFTHGAAGGLPVPYERWIEMLRVNESFGFTGMKAVWTYIDLMRRRGHLLSVLEYNRILKALSNNAWTIRQRGVSVAAMDIARDQTWVEMEEQGPGQHPDIHSFNTVLEGYIRELISGSRDSDEYIEEILAGLYTDNRLLQPNLQTFLLMFEFFAINRYLDTGRRYFWALVNFYGPHILRQLPQEEDRGRGSALDIYVRGLVQSARIDELLLVLANMERAGLKVNPRVMVVNQWGRSLCTSWVDPMDVEVDLGFFNDPLEKFRVVEIEGQDLPGSVKARRKPNWAKTDEELAEEKRHNPDDPGFAFFAQGAPSISWQKHLSLLQRRKKLDRLDAAVRRVDPDAPLEERWEAEKLVERCRIDIERSVPIKRVPKAASKLLVAELKEELAGYKQSTVGTRSQLYERVQKARREARARGSEMWVPAGYEGEEPEDKAAAEAALDAEVESRIRMREEAKVVYDHPPLPGDPPDDWLSFLREHRGENSGRAIRPMEPYWYDRGHRYSARQNELDTLLEEKTEEEFEALAVEYLNKKSGTSGLAKDDVQEWWRMEWVDAASGWGFHWEDDERAAYRDGLFEPAESYDRIREFNMARYLMQKVVELGGTPTMEDFCFLIRHAITLEKVEDLPELLQVARERHGYVYGRFLYEDALQAAVEGCQKDTANLLMQEAQVAGVDVSVEVMERVLNMSDEVDESNLSLEEQRKFKEAMREEQRI
ncbi:Pentatricopeptide repeat and SAP domain containing protein [Klebsormidium nitens]|uniref:Pentatricopeptide repeat and SAP domain containing protein n=2 Tax=Klebsormidium TaxID=3174 RepID=A0A1Y1HWP6_KLENI|nr:hypothetical protein [Klebsormidium flaccidum]GAQ83055.1 Pentatricopeptide repeat and SAP domain containing protein [Klebsormidium nitens]|eukprot:GAQ83055.1 Pentatricopeptide repeat and SAP domain containing protein [Klebsormidium nitens]